MANRERITERVTPQGQVEELLDLYEKLEREPRQDLRNQIKQHIEHIRQKMHAQDTDFTFKYKQSHSKYRK